MRNIGLVLEYVGAGYRGFQAQAGEHKTIQGTVERAIERLTGEHSRITGAGRTDAGVHALSQVVNFHTPSGIPAERYAPALNTMLPYDVRVLRSFEAPESFNARFDAMSKVYRYLIVPSGSALPATCPGAALLAGRALLTRGPVSAEAMHEAGQPLVGRHDFRAYAAAGSSAKTTVRTIHRLDVWKDRWESLGLDLVVVEIEADGFLYNMVRIIVGALLEVGIGRADLRAPGDLLASGDRTLGPATAPPDGLYLVSVAYPEPVGSLVHP